MSAEPFGPKYVASIARNCLTEAAVEGAPAVFSATGHSRQNISVAHQQVRCLNLAWALVRAKKVRHGSVVAIVGGGFSGLMLSVALALQRRCIVYLLEKERRLLHNFRSSPFRYLSPNLNTRDLPTRYDPEWARSWVDDMPVFKWKSDMANEVAHQWLREFQGYAKDLPIFVLEDTEVTERSNRSEGGVRLHATLGERQIEINADIAILATGFGEEQNPLKLEDWSYWRAGSPLQYRPGRTGQRPRVLIAGCGDSGVVELMHHVFNGFRHDLISQLYPSGVEGFIQTHLDNSVTRDLRNEVQNYDLPNAISELGWFYNSKHRREANPRFSQNAIEQGGHVEKLERLQLKLLARISDELVKVGVSAHDDITEPGAFKRLTPALARLTANTQLQVRHKLQGDISDFASNEIALIMSHLDLKPYLAELKPGSAQNAFDILMVGATPTPYSEGLSPINLAYLKLCQDAQPIEYRQGKLQRVEEVDGELLAHFDVGDPVRCDRVLTRFGVAHAEVNQRLLRAGQSRFHHGDYLLDSPVLLKDSRYLDQAIESLKNAIAKYRRRSPARRSDPWAPKSLFISTQTLPAEDRPPTDDMITDESVLRMKLKRGVSVRYEDYSERAL